jgi:hypothetical protein
MAQTYIVPIPALTWTALSTGEANVTVQALTDGIVVAVKATQPNTAGGHPLDEGDRTAIFVGLGSTDIVWAYCNKSNKLVVTR